MTPTSATPKSCGTDPLELAKKRKRVSGGSCSPVSHKMVSDSAGGGDVAESVTISASGGGGCSRVCNN